MIEVPGFPLARRSAPARWRSSPKGSHPDRTGGCSSAGCPYHRILVNQDELGARVAARGFRPIDPWELTLEQQIAEFSGAEEVIGVAGAAMTNIVFCRPGMRVVMLAPPQFADTFFWFIATHCGLHYSELRGEVLRQSSHGPAVAGAERAIDRPPGG